MTCFVSDRWLNPCLVCDTCRWRECYSDQHYFATVLSVKGLENETFCHASVINSGVDAPKPRMFPLEAVNADMCVSLPDFSTGMLRCPETQLLPYRMVAAPAFMGVSSNVLVLACFVYEVIAFQLPPMHAIVCSAAATACLFTSACFALFSGCAHLGRQRRQSAGTRWQQN